MGAPLSRLTISLGALIATGCVAPRSPDAHPINDSEIVRWRMANRPFGDLQDLQMGDDSRIPPSFSTLVFEPIYSEDDTECDPSEFLRIEVIGGEKAHAGELVTVRISIPTHLRHQDLRLA